MFSGLDEASPFARFASGIDLLFTVIAVLAIDAVLTGARGAGGAPSGIYVAMVVIVVMTMAVTGGTQ
jgi:hypothetical protein